MEGIIGLLLIVIGLVLIYDVLAGKARTIVGVLNGTVENAKPLGTKKLGK